LADNFRVAHIISSPVGLVPLTCLYWLVWPPSVVGYMEAIANLSDNCFEAEISHHSLRRLSRKCNGSRGKSVRTCEQKVNKEEKLALTFHRNLLILLGKLPLRQIISK